MPRPAEPSGGRPLVRRGLALFVSLLPSVALAGPLYFGGGNSQVSIHAADARIGHQDPSGYVMALGREFDGTWAVDLGTAFGYHLNTGASPGLAADQARFEAGWLALRKRFWWLREYGIAPWVGGGMGHYRFQWQRNEQHLAGEGGFLALGADVSVQGPWLVRAQVSRHFTALRSEPDGGTVHASIMEYSASVIYRFGLH